MDKKYYRTLYSGYIGYVVQAIVNNFVPLLLVTFQKQFEIPTYLLTLIVTFNFGLQIITDSLSAKFVLKHGYKTAGMVAHSLSAVGLILLAILPNIFSGSIASYIGILISVAFTAVGGGLIEVIISPLTQALPVNNKSATMSFLHSFYCVGHIAVVAVSTLYFYIFGIENWKYLAILWAIVPIINLFVYSKAPVNSPEGDDKPVSIKKLFINPYFILFFIMMVAAGAAEQAIAQWISYFAELGLNISKTFGDIFGTCLFAAFMLVSRLLYGTVLQKKRLDKYIAICSVFLIVSYLITVLSPNPLISLLGCAASGFFVGISWPGVYCIAGDVIPVGGTTMFAFLALGGDIGCTTGPALVGIVSSYSSLKMGITSAIIFPVILTVGMFFLINKKPKKTKLLSDD